MSPRYAFEFGGIQYLHGRRTRYRGLAGDGMRLHQFQDESRCITELTDEQVGSLRRSGELRDEKADEQRAKKVSAAACIRSALRWEKADQSEKNIALFKHLFVEEYRLDGSLNLSDANLDRVSAAAWEKRGKFNYMTNAPCARAVRNWISLFDQHGLDGLLPQASLSGNYHPKMAEQSRILMEESVEKYYLSEKRHTALAVHGLVAAQFAKTNETLPEANQVKAPSYRAVLAYVQQLCPFTVAYTRYGKAEAEKRFRVITGGQPTTRHNERWEVDHTRLNVFARLSPDSSIVERPWITVVLDCHTRTVVGFWIGFEAPSVEVTCRALRMAILPKDWVMQKYGEKVINLWPCRNVATLVCTDQGNDFKAKDLRSRLARLKVSTIFTPVLKPWYRARIERHFRTLDGRLVNHLPGTTNSNIFERDEEMLRKNPGPLTLDDIWRFVLRYIVDVYHVKHHRGIEASPLDAYNRSLAENEEMPELPVSQVDAALSWCGERTLNELGIRIRGIFYRGEETAAVYQRAGGSVRVPVFRSPADLSVASFLDPYDGEWKTVHAADSQIERVYGLTEEDYEARRKIELAESDRFDAEEAAQDAYAALDADIDEIAKSRGHKGRTADDADRAQAKLVKATQASFQRLSQGRSPGAGHADDDLNDIFHLGAPPPEAPGAVVANVPKAAAAPRKPRAQSRASVMEEALEPTDAPDEDDDGFADYENQYRQDKDESPS